MTTDTDLDFLSLGDDAPGSTDNVSTEPLDRQNVGQAPKRRGRPPKAAAPAEPSNVTPFPGRPLRDPKPAFSSGVRTVKTKDKARKHVGAVRVGRPLTDKQIEAQKRTLQPAKPGEVRNPGGRPKGTRDRIGKAFLDDFYADWEEHGKNAITACRQEKPTEYVKLAAALLPKQVVIEKNDMTDAELDNRIRQLAGEMGIGNLRPGFDTRESRDAESAGDAPAPGRAPTAH